MTGGSSADGGRDAGAATDAGADTSECRDRGRLADDDDLSLRSRAYGEGVVRGDRWPLSAVDLGKLEWETSGRMRRKHGRCSYGPDGGCTITISRRVYDRAGFEACRETVRHELVHAWQHQHRGALAVVTDDGVALANDASSGADVDFDSDADADVDLASDARYGRDADLETVRVDPGHGPSFHAWVDLLDLSGRCSTPFEPTRADYRYVFECPACGDWWGKHRLCKRVRQAAHGDVGPVGYCYCTDCEVLVYLRDGDRYLDHGDHEDDLVRSFAAGDTVAAPTVALDRMTPTMRPISGE